MPSASQRPIRSSRNRFRQSNSSRLWTSAADPDIHRHQKHGDDDSASDRDPHEAASPESKSDGGDGHPDLAFNDNHLLGDSTGEVITVNTTSGTMMDPIARDATGDNVVDEDSM